MKIAVASGKGGTGKTTVSVTLALTATVPVQILDCDVEEPNVGIFIKPEMLSHENVTVPIPKVDIEKCVQCGECSRVCQFNAIVATGGKVLVFPELCHSCGGCQKICSTGAIHEEDKVIGNVSNGRYGSIEFVQGCIDIGHAMSPPLIRSVKSQAWSNGYVIVDCPPGTSCPVITAFKDCDFALLVTEPTPFGLNDLKLAVETVQTLKTPFGIVINRSNNKDNMIHAYARENSFSILAEIPEMRSVAEAYSRGISPVTVPEVKEIFVGLWQSF
jgi:MinD superfamily P-loop ATPase